MRRVPKLVLSALVALSVALGGVPPETALANSYPNCNEGDSCTQHEAAIGTTHYSTIGEAINAANSASGNGTTTVKLLKDATLGLDYSQQKAVMKNMTLDLGGHTLRYAGVYGFTVNYNVTFTIQNGTYKNTNNKGTGIQAYKQSYTGPGCTIIIAEDATVKAYDGIVTVGHTDLTVKGKIISNNIAVFGMGPQNDVTLDGATINAGVYGVYQQSYDGGSTYTIKDSTITTPTTGETCAVFISNNKASSEETTQEGMQTLIIENSVISGQDGIEVMYTNVTISGEGTQVTAAEDGHALGVTHKDSGGEEASGNLSISGGTFNGAIGFMAPNNATLTISGGTFTADVSEYVAEGMKQDENGNIIVDSATAEAKIDDDYFLTLEEALKAAESGDTVVLLHDATLPQAIGSGVTLCVNSGVKLFVNDGTYLAAGTLEVQAGGALVMNNSEGSPESFVGDEIARLNLTKGSVTLAVANGEPVVTLKSGSEANVPENKQFFLLFGNDAGMNASVEDGSTLTVYGKLTAVNGSTLTVNGTLNVASGGILRVNSQAGLNGSGAVTNRGTITLHSGANAHTTVVIPITLASGGKVYSQFPVTEDVLGPSGNVSHSTGSFTVEGVNDGSGTTPLTFSDLYAYYAAPTPGPTTYSVIVADTENGEAVADRATAEAGETVTVTATPAEGYEVASVAVTSGNQRLEVTDNGDGTFTFEMPAGNVTVTVAFEASAPVVDLPFTDVAGDAWYRGAVAFVYANRLMTGYEGTTLFGPEDDLGREQAAMVLFRALGGASQAPAPDCGLADVSQGDWYDVAVNWAVASGLMTGYDDGSGLFGVGDALTRDQFAAIIARVAKADLSKADPSVLDGFSDGGEVAEWAVPAVSWAAQAGILEGSDDGEGGMELRPSVEITRGEMATMIQRAAEAGLLPTA